MSDDSGDRAYYMVRHLYADPSKLDGVQLHNYDGIDEWLGSSRTCRASCMDRFRVQCWECGICSPLTAVGTHGVTLTSSRTTWPARSSARRGSPGRRHHRGDPPAIDLVIAAADQGCAGNPAVVRDAGHKMRNGHVPGQPDRSIADGPRIHGDDPHLVSASSLTRTTTFGSNVFGYRFVVPGGHVTIVWLTNHTWVTADTTKLGTIRSMTNEYGTETIQLHSAYRFAQNPVYIHTT